MAFRPEREAQLREVLKGHPRADHVVGAIKELHGWLAKVRPSPFYPFPLPPRSLTLFLPPPALLHGWLVKGGYVYARVRVWVAAGYALQTAST